MSEKKMTGSGHSKLMHYGMMACCAIMFLPIVGYLIAGGTIGGLWGNSIAFLPLLLCVGAHFVMHKMMGKSCHGASKKEERTNEIPPLTDQRVENTQRQGV
ncbi:Protein of unknown function [Aliiroseovarius crassostreae]|uniref:DUF2933 domain-containing protein n=1 Tax=Aliiroseovarius crassostreae TaxID=154981 RepID=A0A0P7J4R7_9RHOB|nr:DUF2933 domain-containing protein [Aliiroseovarius crassostreae]KPN62772.1 hypothetical protein AKJ29_01100 [Aliiroseovarius crassostreae]SFU86346.1 Protein of unknown function [Aliiroseovarius crassostreae]